ncbi:TPA: FRG domain-containing protein [Stenotrophomonas maltophilia]
MKEVLVSSLQEYIALVLQGDAVGQLYRGQADRNWPLEPSIFRDKEKLARLWGEAYATREETLLYHFKIESRPYLQQVPNSRLEEIVVAQHHGLPTRLLDWTLSPLIALLFAVSDHRAGTDPCVIVCDQVEFIQLDEDLLGDPNKITEPVAFTPLHSSARVKNQQSVFTVNVNDEYPHLRKIVLPGKLSNMIQFQLHQLGINSKSIYPDLDGVANWIKRFHLVGLE